MRRNTISGAIITVAIAISSSPISAQETVKIGLILPMTSGQASTGKQIDNAIKLFTKQNGDSVAGKKIEIIIEDDAALPDNTKRLAQELIVKHGNGAVAGTANIRLRPISDHTVLGRRVDSFQHHTIKG
jgi:branched-chain amino acid transport system substrate-binding protein